MKGSNWLRFTMVGLAAAVATACTSPSSGGTQTPDGGHAGDSNCFQQMTPAQQQELQDYATDQGDTTTTGTNADGTQTVCVLEADGSGGYEEHYYAEEDHFSDYLLYSLLLGHSNTLMTVGVLTGDLSVGDAIALSVLTSIGSDGRAYHPYTHHSDGSWARQKQVINNYRVTKIQYGSRPAKPFKTAYKQGPPPGYKKPTLVPVTKPQQNMGVPSSTKAKTPGSSKTSTPTKSTPAPTKANTPTPTKAKPPAATPRPAPKPPVQAPKPAPKPPKTK